MLRIVFVTRPFGFGGTEKHLADLIERLDSAYEVIVLTTGLDPYSERLGRGRGPRVQVLPGPRKGRFLASWSALRSLRPQIVVFINGDFPLFNWQMYLAARCSGARRVVAIEHSIANPPADGGLRSALRAPRRRWRALRAWLTGPVRRGVTMRLPGRLCDVTICVSDAVRDRLVHEYHYPEGKTVTRRNGVDTERFARGANVWPTPPILAGESGPVAVCVALLVPIKRIDVLVRAMKTVVARFPECRCVVVGSGPLESQLRALTGELGLEHNVLFTGHRDDVRPYLASADIFVLPSEREGLPLSLLEAMAFGLPCVATQAGGNLEVVRDGLNGYVVPSGSIPALAGAIEGLFGDRKARARMSQNARRTVEEEFDIEKSMAGVKAAILGGV